MVAKPTPLQKQCSCGAEKTDGYPLYCHLCKTFTHTAYIKGDNG